MGIIRFIKNQIRHDRNTKRFLNENAVRIEELLQEVKSDSISRRTDWLKEKVLSCEEPGITSNRDCNVEVIVSLTSYGRRINEVYLAIESIMQGTVKPNRIILWLAEDEFKGKALPINLKRQQTRGLQVEYCQDIKSYKKIIPAMERFPDACIVTIDDDLMYEFDLLENLIRTHKENPSDICACRMHRISLDKDYKPESYLRWEHSIYPTNKSNLHFLTSGGGTLFPPNCFTSEFFNREVFMSICPFADDVWINAMIWLCKRSISKAYTHSLKGCDYVPTSIEQDYALSEENTSDFRCRNDIQLKAVMDKYDLYHYLVEGRE